MDKFSVNQLAKLSGVSVRTLHYYDEVGLLKPAIRTDSGYRYYSRAEVLRLQQIRFYKELDIPLNRIQELLDEEGFDMVEALNGHKKELQLRIKRLKTLVNTIDTTIDNLKTENMNYGEMYKGFTKEQVDAYEKEVTDRWGNDKLEESKRNINAMSKEQLAALKEEGDAISNALVVVMDKSPTDGAVQELVKRHYKWINQFYKCPIDMYKGIGELYVQDERYKAHYEAYKTGLADFLHKAIEIFCKEVK